eukprot:4849670-Alexandrium_andersonii.AAC.1
MISWARSGAPCAVKAPAAAAWRAQAYTRLRTLASFFQNQARAPPGGQEPGAHRAHVLLGGPVAPRLELAPPGQPLGEGR